MKTTQRYKFILMVMLGLAVVASCVPQNPIPVYVTPTPQQTVVEQVAVSTEETPVPPTAAFFVLPTSTPRTQVASPEPTATTAVETPTPESVLPTATIVPTLALTTDAPVITNTPSGPTPTFMGAIVGPNYVLPPTSTPRPTMTTTDEATPTIGPSPTPLPGIDLSQVGVQLTGLNVDGPDFNEDLFRVEEHLGLGWVKLQVPWDVVQPNGEGEVSEAFRRLEIYVETAHGRGLNTLLSIAKAPDWARSTTEMDGPPNDPQQLANFITLMLREFGGAVSAIEVWNEPNLDREWLGQPISGGRYMDYFRPAYDAIRAYSPSIVIITAGLAPTSTSAGTVDDREFLRQMYAAGLANYTDIAIGIHPYGWGNAPDARCCDNTETRGWDDRPQFFFMNTMEDYRNIMVNSGHSNNELWVTELGWATWDRFPGDPPEAWMGYNSEQDQANYTLRALQIMSELDYVGVQIIWNLDFAVPILIDNRDERITYSLVLPEGNPQERPLYWMLNQINVATQSDED